MVPFLEGFPSALMTSTTCSHPILPATIPAHPRLLAETSDWGRLATQVMGDSVSGSIFASLQTRAELLLSVPPLERVLTGYRLLAISREALERIAALVVVFKVTNELRYALRAGEEIKAVCRFTDWNPNHFLDTAEMAFAVALGLDWLHDFLSAAEQKEASQALKEKALLPSLDEPERWFVKGNNNWNQVCHSGLAMAAIAIAEREPQLAERILARAIGNLHYAAIAYAPNGAYPEGPTYWVYGTIYHVLLAAALVRLTGSTQGVDAYAGFVASADYINQVTTPQGRFYTYADAEPTRHLLAPLFWFARQYRRPDWLRVDLRLLKENLGLYEQHHFDHYRFLAMVLLWRDPSLDSAIETGPATHWLGRGTMPVATHRSSFADPRALYAALKGGSAALNHAHMDVGSFFLEADGVIWADDLEKEEYHLLEAAGVNLWDASQSGTRWSLFRFGPESHNILRFNDCPQLLTGSAHFTHFRAEGPRPHSVLDLSSVYSHHATSVQRGLMMLENKAILLQDEWIAGSEEVQVTWQMLTPAEVTVSASEIALTFGGERLLLRVLEPSSATLGYQQTAELEGPFDSPNPGYKRLTIRLCPRAGEKGVLRILAVPGSSGIVSAPPLLPLEEWSERLERTSDSDQE